MGRVTILVDNTVARAFPKGLRTSRSYRPSATADASSE